MIPQGVKAFTKDEIDFDEVRKIEELVLNQKTGYPKPVAAADFMQFTSGSRRIFLHQKGIYQVITNELINFLSAIIGNKKAIEIAAGYGTLGRALDIPITDAKIQDMPEVKMIYQMTGQPVIKYPGYVKTLDAKSALKKYKPQVMIGCWITGRVDIHGNNLNAYGPSEMEFFTNPHLHTYIVVGHDKIHSNKDIMKIEHDVIKAPWLVSRTENGDNGDNCIYIWSRNDIDYSNIDLDFVVRKNVHL